MLSQLLIRNYMEAKTTVWWYLNGYLTKPVTDPADYHWAVSDTKVKAFLKIDDDLVERFLAGEREAAVEVYRHILQGNAIRVWLLDKRLITTIPTNANKWMAQLRDALKKTKLRINQITLFQIGYRTQKGSLFTYDFPRFMGKTTESKELGGVRITRKKLFTRGVRFPFSWLYNLEYPGEFDSQFKGSELGLLKRRIEQLTGKRLTTNEFKALLPITPTEARDYSDWNAALRGTWKGWFYVKGKLYPVKSDHFMWIISSIGSRVLGIPQNLINDYNRTQDEDVEEEIWAISWKKNPMEIRLAGTILGVRVIGADQPSVVDKVRDVVAMNVPLKGVTEVIVEDPVTGEFEIYHPDEFIAGK